MKMYNMDNQAIMPILIPMDPDEFWNKIRSVIAEEMAKHQKVETLESIYKTPGLTYKPLYKISEVCSFLQVTRPTLYEWIKEGRLKRYKIKSRVYFLYQDIVQLVGAEYKESQ